MEGNDAIVKCSLPSFAADFLQVVSWSSDESRWTVTYKNKRDDTDEIITCDFLYFCVGYYDYDKAYQVYKNNRL